MSDSYREQRPLLCDDCSEEEIHVKSYNYQRRNNRPSVHTGRAREYAKGAVTVITRWPDNCSTSVAYWWLAISMIAITIFVIYNSVLIFGMIPKMDVKQPKYRIFNNEIKPKVQTLPVPDVYLHVIINDSADNDVDINEYLTFVTDLSKKYPNFTYNFFIVTNDTAKDFSDFNDDERNEIAFNSLWSNNNSNREISTKYNIIIKNISLSSLLNDSPIKKFWRHLPPYLTEFMVRSVSIWERGGIAINPKILVPGISNLKYSDKIYEIFDKFLNTRSNFTKRIEKTNPFKASTTKLPNNIRDIINALNDADNNILKTDLSEAETNNVVVLSDENILKFKRDSKRITKRSYENSSFRTENIQPDKSEKKLNNTSAVTANNTRVIENILPVFLKHLFDSKSQTGVVSNSLKIKNIEIPKNNTSSLLNPLIRFTQNGLISTEEKLKILKESDEFMSNNTTSESLNRQKSKATIDHFKKSVVSDFSIDIKGNIIATKTACHGFLGTIFSNVFQHTEYETLTDFIISELSLFCNGLLRSCVGIDLILV